jgi:UDP-glucuronate decarboxylase
MDSPPSFTGPVNLGNPVEFTMRELAERILKETGSSSKLVNMALPQDDPKQRQPDISLAKAKLGWEPKIKLADGLKPTVDFFRQGRCQVKRVPLALERYFSTFKINSDAALACQRLRLAAGSHL